MAEYIEREAALDIVKRTAGDYAAAWTEIRKLPADDVEPVVRGKWVYIDGDEFSETYTCSACGYVEELCIEIYNDNLSPHCPNCGADMRKVR